MATKVKPTRLNVTWTPQVWQVPMYVDADSFQWWTGWWSDIVYATQAEYNALLPGALTDNKHYVIYKESWSPWVNTIAYFPFSSDSLDVTWNNSLTNSWTQDWLWWKFTSSSSITTPSWTVGYVNYWIKIDDYPSSNCAICLAHSKWMWYYAYQWDSRINKKIFVWYDSSRTPSAVSFQPTTWTWHNISYWYDGTKMIYSIDGVVWTLYNWDGYDFGDEVIVSQWWNIVLSKLILETDARTAQEISDYYNETKWYYWIS